MDGSNEQDEVLIKYLLNEQSRAQNEDLEDEMSIHPALEERMRVIEMNLIDSYVLNQMSPTDKARFEEGFFLFPENRNKVSDARAFHEAVRRRPEVKLVSLPAAGGRFRPVWMTIFLRAPAPSFGIAALIVITVLIIGTLVILKKNGRVLTKNMPAQQGQPSPSRSIKDNDGSQGSTLAEASPSPINHPSNQPPATAKNARANSVPAPDIIASVDEIGMTAAGVLRGASSGNAAAQALLLKIPKGAKHFILRVNLKPNEYLAKNLNCSVAISDSESRVHYPKGEGRYLPVTATRFEGKSPYQVSIRVPTNFLRERTLYYFKVRETEKVTPFKIRFGS